MSKESIQERIKQQLQQLEPQFLDIINESAAHHGHIGQTQAPHPRESHFFISIASAKFKNLSTLEQHRLVYDCLTDILKSEIHALRLETRA